MWSCPPIALPSRSIPIIRAGFACDGAFQPIGEGLACVGHEIRRGPDWLGPDWLGRAGGVCLIDSDGSTGFDRGGADPRRAAAYAVGS